MTKKIEPIPTWLGYAGNKHKQIETLMKLIPKKTETFVDLFGGTGVVGCNAYHHHRCKRVVYNDLEYDLMLTLKNLHNFTGDQVLGVYASLFYPKEAAYDGDNVAVITDGKTGFPTLRRPIAPRTKKGAKPKKPKTPKLRVPNEEFRELYTQTLDRYNKQRFIPWDLERQEIDVAKTLEQATETGYFTGSADGKLMYRFPKSEVEEIIEQGGDFQNPFDFMFLSRNSFLQTPRLKNNGREFGSMTPRLGAARSPYVNIRKTEEDIRQFFDAWHKTPVEFFSVNFTEGWLSLADHERPRHAEMRRRWNELLDSLGPHDFVFIDPPYHGSKAGYNAKWKLSMEIYLMAFCQQLDQKGIPFLITNNLGWNRTIFIEWTRLPHIHTYLWSEEAAYKLYSGAAEKNKYEVYVSNKCFPAAKYALPEGLMEVVLYERTADELPAEIRYVEKERGKTYKQRKAKAQKSKEWTPPKRTKK